VLHKKLGDRVAKGEPLLTVHANDRHRLDEVTTLLRDSILIAPEASPTPPLIREILR
jgi:pyrimidine-nucleoside phosphorylase